MKQSILIGNSNFSSIRENNYFYVDKTNFIKEWWENAHIDTLLMRPPNFGKTLNLSMIDSYYKEDWTEIYRLKIPNQETLLLLKSML